MMWVWVVPIVGWLAGYLYRRARGPLVDQHDIRYHWESRVARTAAMLRHSHNNYAVTIGRHTWVRLDYIRSEHASHEFRHSLQAEKWGAVLFLVRAFYEYARYGYLNSPIEREARDYAALNAARFRECHA